MTNCCTSCLIVKSCSFLRMLERTRSSATCRLVAMKRHPGHVLSRRTVLPERDGRGRIGDDARREVGLRKRIMLVNRLLCAAAGQYTEGHKKREGDRDTGFVHSSRFAGSEPATMERLAMCVSIHAFLL